MDIRKGLQKRIALGWLLMALILAPAVAIIVWLAVLKSPPGNAVLIGDSQARVTALATHDIAEATAPTPRSNLFVATTREAAPEITVQPKDVSSVSTREPDPVSQPTPPSTTIETVTVFVTGAVISPGVYTLPVGARIRDAVNAAGGVSLDADLNTINFAARIADEDHIIVPEKGAAPVGATETPLHSTPLGTSRPTSVPTRSSHAPTAGPQSSSGKKIDINHASQAELEAIPGVGPVLAARIVAFREAHGSFASIEDLVVVPGIKEALLAKMRDSITATP